MYNDEYIVLLMGLYRDCPYGTALDNCPIKDLRKKGSVREFFLWLKSCPQEELISYLECHQKCLAKREGKKGISGEII